MESNETNGFPETQTKDQQNISAFSSTVLTFAFCFIGFKLISYSVNVIKNFNLKNTLNRCGAGLFFGSPEDLMKSLFAYLEKAEPTPYTFWLGYVRYVLIGKPEDLQVVLNSSNCLEKSYMYKFFINTVGEGLFSSSVEKWKKHRRIITPAFNMRLLEGFFPIFNEKNSYLVTKLEKEADSGEFFDLWPYISTNALDIVCQTTMGYNINSLQSAKIEFEEALRRASVADTLRIYKPWLHPDFIFNIYIWFNGLKKCYDCIHKLPEQIIQQKQKELSEKLRTGIEVKKEKFSLSFLDLLLTLNEEGAEFSDTDMRDEVVTMMIGGSETSALTLSFTFLMLAMHPKEQEKAFEEVMRVLGDEDRPIGIEDTNKMTYLEQCIRETLRLFPPGPLILRRATKDILLSDDFVLRAGANVIIPPIKVQRDPTLYKDPLLWDPQHFSTEELAERHKYSFIAFSGGPRGCIGSKYAMLSMKVTVSMVLKKYFLTTDVKMNEIRLGVDLLMRSIRGYKVKIHSRKNNSYV